MKMPRLYKFILLPLTFATPLASASVVLLEDGRFVTQTQVSPPLPVARYEPTSPFASWTYGILQNSQVTSQLMNGHAYGYHSTPSMTDVEYTYIDYRSIFDIKFEVQTAQILTLDFILTAGGWGPGIPRPTSG